MSTDQQDLSIGIQRAAIRKYAVEQKLEVVATYEDSGRSGLVIRNRKGMLGLLRDIAEKDCAFSQVLVYDISRWGRFQNTDASAYYDYLCRLNGVEVIYVAEAFGDPTSPMATVIKGLKRAMAAEYSRELAVKTRAGQRRVVQMGFSLGSTPAIGYRRQVVSREGEMKGILGFGERKPMPSDRVRWVLGPSHEVALVRRIFRLYADPEMSISGLVNLLNREGLTNRNSKIFTHRIVRDLLTCETFAGNFVWGRSADVHAAGAATGHYEPVRNNGGIPAIISINQWEKTQRKISKGFWPKKGHQQLLDDLRKAFEKKPDATEIDLPGLGCSVPFTYRRAFGSMAAAYALIGIDPLAWLQRRTTAQHRSMAIASAFRGDVAAWLNLEGVPVTYVKGARHLLVNRCLKVGVDLVWQAHHKTGLKARLAKRAPGFDFDQMILMRMNDDGTAKDFFMFPRVHYFQLPLWIGETVFDAASAYHCPTGTSLIARLRHLVETQSIGNSLSDPL
ncbi:recombinase family protein [Caenimonas sp. DR4.4]|uniref:Recombinase family protein n=2 Tax=Caenimonas aquaedulcis TaxID=2793270 RepID=A0A931H6K4_9BURK|nr:recombinase family protein [Caenimonas aquaedulcis]